MARSPYTWGIDIGKCGLKALRCRRSPETGGIVADAFDYIEYPMLLTQPEADATELVRDALERFTSRNELAGDRVAVSVPGQSGLSKFIKLPPVEAAKIADIVRYEARQQIPFPLDQVIWSWQRLLGGIEESGFVLDAEVALFAMKRDQVAKALRPLTDAKIRVDILQLTPVSLANLVIFDQLPPPDKIDPDSPPPSVVLVSIGVDSTDLVITNGLKIWQRTMPMGGNSFTRALVSGMRMTFAKAEQLKRNVAKAEDPKSVFQVLRPVFTEFAGELQRSLNYFTGADRTATIGKVLLVGNAARLRGLSDFLAKQLQLEVARLDGYRGLDGPAVTKAPAFRENQLAFATAYGLVLQGVGAGVLRTNLLPPEIGRDRIISAKKPWALAAMLGLLVAALVNFLGLFVAWSSYTPSLFQSAFAKADAVVKRSGEVIASLEQARSEQADVIQKQQQLLRVLDRRFQALELMRAVETLLPRKEPSLTRIGEVKEAVETDGVEEAINFDELHIDSLDLQYFPDLASWFESVRDQWQETVQVDAALTAADEKPAVEGSLEVGAETATAASDEQNENVADAAESATAADETGGGDEEAAEAGPTGGGWVVQMVGHHYHNEQRHAPFEGRTFLRATLVKNILSDERSIPVAAGPLVGERVSPQVLGIGFPVIISTSRIQSQYVMPEDGGADSAVSGMGPAPRPSGRRSRRGEKPPVPGRGSPDGQEADRIELRRYDFVLQFVWQPRSPGSVAQPASPEPE